MKICAGRKTSRERWHAVLGSDNNPWVPSDGDCSCVKTTRPHPVAREHQTRCRIRLWKVTRPRAILWIKLSYLELEGSSRQPTKPICICGIIIGLPEGLLGLLVMKEYPLGDGAREG